MLDVHAAFRLIYQADLRWSLPLRVNTINGLFDVVISELLRVVEGEHSQ